MFFQASSMLSTYQSWICPPVTVGCCWALLLLSVQCNWLSISNYQVYSCIWFCWEPPEHLDIWLWLWLWPNVLESYAAAVYSAAVYDSRISNPKEKGRVVFWLGWWGVASLIVSHRLCYWLRQVAININKFQLQWIVRGIKNNNNIAGIIVWDVVLCHGRIIKFNGMFFCI